MKEAHIPPMQALISAQSLAADSLGIGDHTGSIAAGYDADIIAVDGDPIADITATQRVVFVMKRGSTLRGADGVRTAGSGKSSAGERYAQ